VAEKDVTIAKLSNENEALKGQAGKAGELVSKVSRLEQTIADKDASITALTSENEALKGQADQVGPLKTKISELECLVSEKVTSIASLTQENQVLKGQAGEVGTLVARVSELERTLAEKDAFMAGKDASIATLNAENQALKAQANDAGALAERVSELEKTIAERDVSISTLSNENEALKGQAEQVGPLQEKVANLGTAVNEKDASIGSLSAEIAGLKKKLEECMSSSAADAELQKKLEKIEREMKYLLKFLEKSPKHQLLYVISDLETTDLIKLKEMTGFDDGLIRRVLDELQEENMIICSPVPGEATNMTVRIIAKLNPITYLDVDLSIFPDVETFSTKNYEASFDKSLLRLQKVAETHPETAGYLASRLLIQAYKKRDYPRVTRLNEMLGKLKESSFYTRLVDNIFAKSYEEKRNDAILNGAIDMPDLSILDNEYNHVNDGDKLAQNPPFKVMGLSKIAVTEEGEPVSVPDSEHHEFPSIQAMAHWAWLASRGKKIKVDFKDGKDNSFSVVVSMTGPRFAELVKKAFEGRMT
nr:hypothetical protein [Candidatus Sigynarchaeota archaeon]